jgi:hypothetical protein
MTRFDSSQVLTAFDVLVDLARSIEPRTSIRSAWSVSAIWVAALLTLAASASGASITSIFPTSDVAPGDSVTVQGSGFWGPTVCNTQYNLMLECSAYVSTTPNQVWSAETQYPALHCSYISSSTILVRVPHTSLGSNYLTIIEVPTYTEGTPASFTSSQTVSISIPSMMKVYPFTGAPVVVALDGGCSAGCYVKVSLWGSPGEGGIRPPNEYSAGGKGGLTEGIVPFNAGDTLTITVGGNNGYNGGGTTGTDGSTCFAGGGATDLRKNGASLGHRIMVAGGGGGYGQSWAGYFGCGGSGRQHATGHTFGITNNACCHMNFGHAGVTWAGGGPPGGELDDRLDNVTFPYILEAGGIQNSGGSGGSGTQSRGGTLRFGLATPVGVAGSLGQGGQCLRRCRTNMGHHVGSGGGGGGYYGGSGGPQCDGNGYGWYGGGGSGYVSNDIIDGTVSSRGGLVRPAGLNRIVHGFAYVTQLLEAPSVTPSVRLSLSDILPRILLGDLPLMNSCPCFSCAIDMTSVPDLESQNLHLQSNGQKVCALSQRQQPTPVCSRVPVPRHRHMTNVVSTLLIPPPRILHWEMITIRPTRRAQGSRTMYTAQSSTTCTHTSAVTPPSSTRCSYPSPTSIH